MELAEVDITRIGYLPADELLEFAFDHFGNRAAIGTSLQKTGLVMIDLIARLCVPFRVFFVDTLLNYPETYELIDEVEQRYEIKIERFEPDAESVESLHTCFGQHAHYFGRELCCQTRKTIPLQRALATLDVWGTGLRADQSAHRQANTAKAGLIKTDAGKTVLKLSPLLDWTAEEINGYIDDQDLPYNKLYDYVSPYNERFTVIGCQPCHVPVKPEFHRRMGKFPWEQGSKECGIHEHGGGI